MYVRNGWPQTNFVEYFLCIGTTKYTKASPPARKMQLFSYIIIKNILSYVIIKIYIILDIYLQVSETEGLAELHEVNRVHLVQYECAFKNPNVLNIEAS